MTGSATLLWVITVVLLLSSGVISLAYGKNRLRYVTLLLSLAFFGFYNTAGLAGPGWLQDTILKLKEFGDFLPFYLIIIAILLFTLVFGQFFCGWVCPMGAVQEFLHDFHKKEVKIPDRVDKWLGLAKYIFAFYLILHAIVKHTKLHYLNPFFVVFNLDGSTPLVIVAAIILLLSVFIYRPWCRWFCPFSAILNLLGKISLFQLSTNENCTNCSLGERVCRIGAIKVEKDESGKRQTRVINSRCIRCGDCVTSCPWKGIELKFRAK